MINHTMMVSFDRPLPAAMLDQYLADIERAMLDTGLAHSVVTRRHIPAPGEEVVPALIATAIVQVTVADIEALAQAFTAPGVHEVIDRWQARHPYQVAWANHEPLMSGATGMHEVSRKVALVTGAGSGIGRATALEFARGGAAVAVCDIDEGTAAETTEMIRKDGGDALTAVVDIADEHSVQAAVERTVTAYGGLDIAVNNAGMASHHRQLDQMTLAEFERVVHVNLAGTFLCMKYELPALRRRGGGAIVNIASNGGLYAIPTAPAYVAAKHGIVGLTKVAAVDHAPQGIRVNAVCPGPTRTPGFEKLAVGTDMIPMQEAITPLGRLATPEEVAAAAVWLCSDAASYVTGIAMSVDGGRRA